MRGTAGEHLLIIIPSCDTPPDAPLGGRRGRTTGVGCIRGSDNEFAQWPINKFSCNCHRVVRGFCSGGATWTEGLGAFYRFPGGSVEVASPDTLGTSSMRGNWVKRSETQRKRVWIPPPPPLGPKDLVKSHSGRHKGTEERGHTERVGATTTSPDEDSRRRTFSNLVLVRSLLGLSQA